MAFAGFSVPELNVLLPVGLIFQKIAGKVTNAADYSENSYRGTKIISCVWELMSSSSFWVLRGSKIKFLYNVCSKVCKGVLSSHEKKVIFEMIKILKNQLKML